MVKAIYSKKAGRHEGPIPAAAMHRGLLITSGIFGRDPETDIFPADPATQIEMAFDQFHAILAEAGATPHDVVKADLYFTDKKYRALVNPIWEKIWPDPAHRPARHAHQASLPEGCIFQIVATAMLASDS